MDFYGCKLILRNLYFSQLACIAPSTNEPHSPTAAQAPPANEAPAEAAALAVAQPSVEELPVVRESPVAGSAGGGIVRTRSSIAALFGNADEVKEDSQHVVADAPTVDMQPRVDRHEHIVRDTTTEVGKRTDGRTCSPSTLADSFNPFDGSNLHRDGSPYISAKVNILTVVIFLCRYVCALE